MFSTAHPLQLEGTLAVGLCEFALGRRRVYAKMGVERRAFAYKPA